MLAIVNGKARNGFSYFRSKNTASFVAKRPPERRRVDWAKVIAIPPPREALAAPPGCARTRYLSLVTAIKVLFDGSFVGLRNNHRTRNVFFSNT